MDCSLEDLTSTGWKEAPAARQRIADLALERQNTVARREGRRGFDSVAEYAADLASRTCCLTLLAGAGTRWIKSLKAAAALPETERPSWYDPDFNIEKPRGLYPVRDHIRHAACTPRGSGTRMDGRIPIAAYALAAAQGLGFHLIVVRGWEKEIDAEVLAPLGIKPEERRYHTQDAPFGKPLGHGDAAWQCRDILADYEYVIANFGGDANSHTTMLCSLLALDALNAGAAGSCAAGSTDGADREGRDGRREASAPVDFLIPAAPIAGAAYPIVLDDEGLPRAFGHQKLQGHSMGPGSGYTNVGVRLYRASALVEKLGLFRDRYWNPDCGYEIPGNDPEGHEFALDNVDAEFAAEGRARMLAIAHSEELTPAKCLDDIPAFEQAAAKAAAAD